MRSLKPIIFFIMIGTIYNLGFCQLSFAVDVGKSKNSDKNFVKAPKKNKIDSLVYGRVELPKIVTGSSVIGQRVKQQYTETKRIYKISLKTLENVKKIFNYSLLIEKICKEKIFTIRNMMMFKFQPGDEKLLEQLDVINVNLQKFIDNYTEIRNNYYTLQQVENISIYLNNSIKKTLKLDAVNKNDKQNKKNIILLLHVIDGIKTELKEAGDFIKKLLDTQEVFIGTIKEDVSDITVKIMAGNNVGQESSKGNNIIDGNYNNGYEITKSSENEIDFSKIKKYFLTQRKSYNKLIINVKSVSKSYKTEQAKIINKIIYLAKESNFKQDNILLKVFDDERKYFIHIETIS